MSIGPFALLAPWCLVALIALPILWWLLRAVPPAAKRHVFPGVRLLLGLDDSERMPARTPWWLLLLRMAALAVAILAFSEPVLNPRAERGEGPLVILLDGGWGDAPDWERRMEVVVGELTEAARDDRPVAVLSIADGPPRGELPLRGAGDWENRLAGLAPRAWPPDPVPWAEWARAQPEGFETIWLNDGIAQDGEPELAGALLERGDVSLMQPSAAARALTPARVKQGALEVTALRVPAETAGPVSVTALGTDPNGVERVLGTGEAAFEPGAGTAEVGIDMPVELRNRVSRLQIPADKSAAAVVLADDALRRRKVGLMSGRAGSEAQDLVDPLNYLRKALEPFAETVEAPLSELMLAAPDVLMLADVGNLGDSERGAVLEWIEMGGVLVRFAGPRLARSGAGMLAEDPLLPVRLRAGGRSVGGAMSWGAPQKLRGFPEDSPFAGLAVPGDVEISAQVMAQPDPALPERVYASLEDGTPLVTGVERGEGRVVLFHITASADWSNLPLSGLFVQMLERLTQSAGGLGGEAGEELAGSVWTPVTVLDGFGDPATPTLLAGVEGARLAEGNPSAEVPPGIYASGTRRIALNVMEADATLEPLAPLPAGVVIESMGGRQETYLGPWLIAAAAGLLALDLVLTLLVSGRLVPARRSRMSAAALAAFMAVAAVLAIAPAPIGAQEGGGDAAALYAANNTVLAYVRTGDARIDRVSEAGLAGLSRELFERTAIDPADPVGVDLETDELSLLPLLYWPVTEAQQQPSDAAYARLNDYLRTGGMIVFDTLDSDIAATFNGTTPNGRALQRTALKLDIPPLAEIPPDHVLTRTFYLLQDFPGRWYNAPVWVEAPRNTETVEGLPFRNLNDGVTPVIVGGNDWASAWAIDENGAPMFRVGRGISGERQREMAYRFGINLVMHVMTGNYKSDQVHVPALLERLGQ